MSNNGKTIEVPLDVMKQSVEITAKAGALCEKIAADMGVVEGKAGLVADALIKSGVLDPADKARTVEMLQDPKQALDITARVAELAAQPRVMGQPEKRAMEFDPHNSPKKESDRVFEDKLGRVNA